MYPFYIAALILRNLKLKMCLSKRSILTRWIPLYNETKEV